jgi:4-hydroxy-4-methyl-2-oxoglutarate aldolase
MIQGEPPPIKSGDYGDITLTTQVSPNRVHKKVRKITHHEAGGNPLQSLARLYTAVVADILDKLGRRNQVVSPSVRPVYAEARLVGRAYTILGVPSTQRPVPPYEVEFEALDNLAPDNIVVYASQQGVGATWGELFSTRARLRGATGCLTDGMVRDSARITEMKFPTFSAGFCAADTYGRIQAIDHNIPIICGGVEVRPGDCVLGDYDGIVIIPAEIVEDLIRLANEKASIEDKVRTALMNGESVKAVHAKYGVM